MLPLNGPRRALLSLEALVAKLAPSKVHLIQAPDTANNFPQTIQPKSAYYWHQSLPSEARLVAAE